MMPTVPLIFAIVADLFNTTIISNEEFKGHESIKGFFVKISAYAEDTGVHLGSLRDIEIYQALLRDSSLATGGITNIAKSEVVLLGKWRDYTPEMGVRVIEASKYLGSSQDPPRSFAIKQLLIVRLRSIDKWNTGTPDSNRPLKTEQ